MTNNCCHRLVLPSATSLQFSILKEQAVVWTRWLTWPICATDRLRGAVPLHTRCLIASHAGYELYSLYFFQTPLFLPPPPPPIPLTFFSSSSPPAAPLLHPSAAPFNDPHFVPSSSSDFSLWSGMESSDDDTLSERSCLSEPSFRSERSAGSLSPCPSGSTAGLPGDTLPWNLSKHERRKRKSQASVLDPAERAVVRVAGKEQSSSTLIVTPEWLCSLRADLNVPI